jgi:hypothetical protein
LPLHQPRDQDALSVRKFKRVVMDVGHVHIDLAKSGYLCANCLVALPAQEKPKASFDFDVIIEGDLRPWKQTNSHVWLSNCRETPCTGIEELGCHQLVSDFCRSTGDEVQTVVTHGDDLLGAPREPLT